MNNSRWNSKKRDAEDEALLLAADLFKKVVIQLINELKSCVCKDVLLNRCKLLGEQEDGTIHKISIRLHETKVDNKGASELLNELLELLKSKITNPKTAEGLVIKSWLDKAVDMSIKFKVIYPKNYKHTNIKFVMKGKAGLDSCFIHESNKMSFKLTTINIIETE